MAIEQQRVHVTGRRAGFANLEEIRLAAILLLNCPRRWRMSELDFGLANPLHNNGDESVRYVAPVDYHKPERNSDTVREHDETSDGGNSAQIQRAASKTSQTPEKKTFDLLSKLERAQTKGKKTGPQLTKGCTRNMGNFRDTESRSRNFGEVGWGARAGCTRYCALLSGVSPSTEQSRGSPKMLPRKMVGLLFDKKKTAGCY